MRKVRRPMLHSDEVQGIQGAQIGPAKGPDPLTLAVGFDAVVQAGIVLLRRQVALNLEAAGLSPLSVRIPYSSASVPDAVRIAVGPQSPLDALRTRELDLELRFVDPL